MLMMMTTTKKKRGSSHREMATVIKNSSLTVCVHELLFKQLDSQNSFEEWEETEQRFDNKVIVSWNNNKEQFKNNSVQSAILFVLKLFLERLSDCFSSDAIKSSFFSLQVCL